MIKLTGGRITNAEGMKILNYIVHFLKTPNIFYVLTELSQSKGDNQ